MREAAREALEEAVDFANEPGARALAASHKNVLTEALSRLFMAVDYAQRYHTTGVFEWLCRDSFQRDLTSLIFALGVRACTDPYAKSLVSDWLANPGLLWAVLPDGCRALVAEFHEEE